MLCCPETSVEIYENSVNYNRFIENINTSIDNLLLRLCLDEFNMIEDIQNDEDIECTICRKNIKKDNLKVILPCSHQFNKKCLINWIKIGNNHCPSCGSVIIN